ncbi:MAG: ribbon-helix-helix protein, CopG family [Actinobacteria bacterium]|nr:ribbon-helix-helix protein, CopG family [Actinomycetota bacterium]
MAVRINITMPEEFVKAVDELASAEHRGRSELIREALREYMAGRAGAVAIGKPRAGKKGARPAATDKDGPVAGIPQRRKASETVLVETLRAFFASREDVALAYLFGSRAKGTAGRMSDLDIAVLFEPGGDRGSMMERRLDIMSRLAELLGEEKVDVLLLNEASPGLRFAVIKDGKPVYAREEGSRIAFEAETCMRYLDFRWVEEDYEAHLARFFKVGSGSGNRGGR